MVVWVIGIVVTLPFTPGPPSQGLGTEDEKIMDSKEKMFSLFPLNATTPSLIEGL